MSWDRHVIGLRVLASRQNCSKIFSYACCQRSRDSSFWRYKFYVVIH